MSRRALLILDGSIPSATDTELVAVVELLELLKRKSDFDLILLDRMMPEMNGMEFMKNIKKKFDNNKDRSEMIYNDRR